MIQCNFKRYEKKYLLTPAQCDAVRKGMEAYMTPDKYSHYTICNVYYDTDDFSLIRTSLEKPVYKEKLRVRSYGVASDGGKVFVE
ncbi:MAG: VTC domain-containing protein, partial [Oscillospiraceae bacterium]|nr:VTC domain-containing protein [Oscillospiraceae bacterium]